MTEKRRREQREGQYKLLLFGAALERQRTGKRGTFVCSTRSLRVLLPPLRFSLSLSLCPSCPSIFRHPPLCTFQQKAQHSSNKKRPVCRSTFFIFTFIFFPLNNLNCSLSLPPFFKIYSPYRQRRERSTANQRAAATSVDALHRARLQPALHRAVKVSTLTHAGITAAFIVNSARLARPTRAHRHTQQQHQHRPTQHVAPISK